MEWLFSWEVTSVVVVAAATIALAVLALNDFKVAKTFFLIAAADAIGGIVMGIKHQDVSTLSQGVFVFVGCGIVGLLLLLSLRYVDSKKPTPTKETGTAAMPTVYKPYDLPDERRAEFLKLLRAPVGANTLKIGCLGWSEQACVAAGRFLLLFSEAGWEIEGGRVFRMNPQIPTDGVSIVNLPVQSPPLPPHLGRWHEMDVTDVTLALAFMKMGVQSTSGNDASLGKRVTGVYFGPEPPDLLSFNPQDMQVIGFAKHIAEARAIEEKASKKPGTTLQEEEAWATETEDWLRTNGGDSTALQFRASLGFDSKMKYLMSLDNQTLKPKPQ